MQLNEANWCTVTLRCLSVDNSLFSIDNPSCSSTSQPSNTVILNWFSMQKSYSRIFLRGAQGGGGQKWLQKSAVTKFKIENTLGVDSYHSVDTQLPFSRHIATIHCIPLEDIAIDCKEVIIWQDQSEKNLHQSNLVVYQS